MCIASDMLVDTRSFVMMKTQLVCANKTGTTF